MEILNGSAPKAGTPIGIMAACAKYKIPRMTLINWVKKGRIRILREGVARGPGTATEIDEAEVAQVASTYEAGRRGRKKKPIEVTFRRIA